MGPVAPAKMHGFMLHRLRMITAEFIGEANRSLASSTRNTLAKSASDCKRAVGVRHLLRKLFPVLAGRSSFRRIIWRRHIIMCMPRAVYASLMKFKSASDG